MAQEVCFKDEGGGGNWERMRSLVPERTEPGSGGRKTVRVAGTTPSPSSGLSEPGGLPGSPRVGRLQMSRKSRTPALLNSPGRKFQGAGGPPWQDFQRPAAGALLAGTRSRCPHVPSADTGLTLLQSTPHGRGAASGSRVLGHACKNTPRVASHLPALGTRLPRARCRCPGALPSPLLAVLLPRVVA